MTEAEDEIRLKELLSVFGVDKQKELIEILHRDQIRYHKEQLDLHVVGCSLISEEEFNTMANDYIKLECNKNEEFNIKAQRFQDYRNGLKNMHKVLK